MFTLEAEILPLFKRSDLAARYLARFDVQTVAKETIPIPVPRVIKFSLVACRIPVYDIHSES